MYRIFGPPGTGKTTTLLNKVDDALQSGVEPTKIAFLAFTRKAAEEAKERAAARFKLDPKKDLYFFRTIHSLALSLSDISPEQVMQPSDYRELSEGMGVHLVTTKSVNFDDDLPDMMKASDPILGLINLARLRKVPLRKQYDMSNTHLTWSEINYVNGCVERYKQVRHKFDFTDMLENFVKEGSNFCPHFDMCFVDEAQDLSPMQWDIASLLDERSKRMYVAGDDDQAIYRWAGADVDTFINLDGGSDTLSQSYRIPYSVHKVAEGIVKRIQRRVVKNYEPRQEMGEVGYYRDIMDIDLSEGSWLIMAQAGYMLEPVAQYLKSFGYLFEYRGSRSISAKISDAVNGWEQLRKGESVTGQTARNIYEYMSAKDSINSCQRIKKGFKRLKGLEDAETVNMQDLNVNHGLLATKDMLWHEAMDRLPERDRAYIIALLRRGERFNGTPRIIVSTIHGTKGGEADNVVVFSDISAAAQRDMTERPDDMHRVFYVAVTRTRERLFIIEGEDLNRSYDI